MKPENFVGIALEELYKMFDVINATYYNNELPYPMITIQASKKSNICGWFTLHKLWMSEETNDEKHEINISASRLRDDVVSIAETLHHEIVHYYNKLSDIVDNHGMVHTKKFKIQAEAVDLIVKKTKYGWNETSASDKFKKFVEEVIKPDKNKFSYFRGFAPPVVTDKKKTQFKYTCPECNAVARAKKDLHFKCVSCNMDMEMESEI
jgi:hypothetical protein